MSLCTGIRQTPRNPLCYCWQREQNDNRRKELYLEDQGQSTSSCLVCKRSVRKLPPKELNKRAHKLDMAFDVFLHRPSIPTGKENESFATLLHSEVSSNWFEFTLTKIVCKRGCFFIFVPELRV
eukprot:m.5599 g.5599  ORF g.5599 m.5599 type:complete len:124 (+) comp4437_c0_seq1:485-856(+)